MELAVFGATGGTGLALLRTALAAGHTVTAAARNPDRILVDDRRLRRVRADVLDPASLDGTLDGADAVLSALGTADGRRPTTVYSAGTGNILAAMRRRGTRRFVGVSALPVTPRTEVGALERLLVYPLLDRFFGESYADMGRMEELLRRSDVDWTVVRPPRLTDGPATGRYRLAVGHHLRGARTISRADLAAAMLQLVDDPASVGAAVGVAY
jgi:putative NADH-flavin reductase